MEFESSTFGSGSARWSRSAHACVCAQLNRAPFRPARKKARVSSSAAAPLRHPSSPAAPNQKVLHSRGWYGTGLRAGSPCACVDNAAAEVDGAPRDMPTRLHRTALLQGLRVGDRRASVHMLHICAHARTHSHAQTAYTRVAHANAQATTTYTCVAHANALATARTHDGAAALLGTDQAWRLPSD